MKKIVIYLALVICLGISCSEDVEVNPELTGPLYGLTKGEAGSVDELIYQTWEEWGMYYLYDYEPYAFQVDNWSADLRKWYTPMKQENKELIRKLIDIVQNGIFVGMDKELVRGSWFVRTFLCDSLCDASDYSASKVVTDFLAKDNFIVIPGFGERMQEYTDEDWDVLKEKLSSLLISRLYKGAAEQPDAFFDSQMKKPDGSKLTIIWKDDYIKDPAGIYLDDLYTFRMNGYINVGLLGMRVPDNDTDFADYISFLTKTEKTELEYNFRVFPKLLERAAHLAPYLMRVLGMDLDAVQQANCPDDPVEDGYFANLKYE